MSAANRAESPVSKTEPTPAELLELVLNSLEDDKAEDVVSVPLKGKTEMADHMVVASGRSSRQVAAMAEHLIDKLKGISRHQTKVEGLETGDWVLLDAGDVIVHIFRPEVRDYYQIEKMWMSPEDVLARRTDA
jgi:ribosome-associated protein